MHEQTRQRSDGNQGGYTLVELLIVFIVIGVLLAIAVPSYLAVRDRASKNTVKTNLRSALPAAQAYYADNGTYVGMTLAALKAINKGLSPTLTVASVTATTYCLTDITNGKRWSVRGPGPKFISDTSTADNWFTTANCT
jgi:prepilin-type N-terminal cleavage/methylation domain-containing protein